MSEWPENGRFVRRESECPECGADGTQNGERSLSVNIAPFVDGGLKVVFEARCPCGWEDRIEFGSSGAN